MSEKPTRVLLVRHAVNDWVGKRLAGWTPGVHLNERGLQQAGALGERLAGAKLAAIYSSPLERARETAAAIAAHHEVVVQIVEGVGETRCGDWTGQSLEELSKSDLWRQVQFAPSMFRFPNGESMLEAQFRMVAALESLRSRHPGATIVVVSHSDPLKALVAYYLGMPLDMFQRINISPASITEVALSPFGGFLLRLNDTAHIAPEPEEEEKPAEEAQEAPDQGHPATESTAAPSNGSDGTGTPEGAGTS